MKRNKKSAPQSCLSFPSSHVSCSHSCTSQDIHQLEHQHEDAYISFICSLQRLNWSPAWLDMTWQPRKMTLDGICQWLWTSRERRAENPADDPLACLIQFLVPRNLLNSPKIHMNTQTLYRVICLICSHSIPLLDTSWEELKINYYCLNSRLLTAD